jgi:hypothetical protein
MRCAAPVTVSATRTGLTPPTVTGAAVGTPAPRRSIWPSRSCGEGSYFPDWLLERRRRAESALVSVVAGHLDTADGEAGRNPRRHPAEQLAGQRDGQGLRRPGRSLPELTVGRRALHLRRRRRTRPQSTGERSDGERARPARDRGERRRLSRSWACTSLPQRTVPAGSRSSATWSPAA